tara:strand:- start:5470 stop:5766 length:297 start_codon:yes stop_codon:yes gene_type:complete
MKLKTFYNIILQNKIKSLIILIIMNKLSCELEEQYKYKNEPNKDLIKKAEKEIKDDKKPIDPKFIFDKKFKKNNKISYRKPKTENAEKINSLDDLMFK